MNEPTHDTPTREWSPNKAFIPREVAVPGSGGRFTALMTADRTVYLRAADTGQIRRHQVKVKGKAARRADKVARRTAKAKGR